MKLLIVLPLLLLSLRVQAVTRGQFVGPHGIIRVVVTDYNGVSDADGRILLDAMDLPVQNSIIGPGKSFQTRDRGLQFICADRPRVGVECSIIIHRQGPGVINAEKKIMQYKVVGEEAAPLTKLFKTDARGEFHFLSIEGALRVDVRPQYFEVYYEDKVSASASL